MWYFWYFCYQLTPHILIIRADSCLLTFHCMDFTGLMIPAVWGEVRYKHFESCSPIGLYSAELSILWTPYLPTSLPHLPTHFWNGRAVCSAAAAGWLASQFPVGRLSRRLVQKRASPELPSIVCIQGGLIYTTYPSLYTQQCNFIFKTGTFIRAINKNTTKS